MCEHKWARAHVSKNFLHAWSLLNHRGIKMQLQHYKGIGHIIPWLCSALLAAWPTTSTSFRGERGQVPKTTCSAY